MIGNVLAIALAAASVRASVTVDTSRIGPEGPVLQRRMLERSDVVLRAHQVLPASEAHDARIRVEVDPMSRDSPGYVLTIDIVAHAHHEEIECALCTETELVARYEERLEILIERIGAQEPPPPDPGPKAIHDVPPPDPPLPDRRPLQAVGKAGIALLVVGAVGIGVGAGLAVNPAKPLADDPLKERATDIPGYVTLGIGAAVLVTGAVLLVVDRGLAARANTRAP